MNLLKTLTFGAMAVAMTGYASATVTTVVHITGSSAYRAAATVAIITQLGNTNCKVASFGGSPIGKGIEQVFANGTLGTSGTATTVVLTNWTGSLTGVVDLVGQNTSLKFLDYTDATVIAKVNASTVVTVAGSPTGYTCNDTALASGVATVSAAPDAAFTDAFQSSVAASIASCGSISGLSINGTPIPNGKTLAAKINSATLGEAGTAGTVSGAGTAAGTVGIVPFEWVSGKTATSTVPFTNITQQAALALLQVGSAPVAFFDTTGAGSTSNFVYLVGRNEDSATRIDAMAEPQYGFGNAPAQFLATFSGATITTTGALPAPVNGVQTGGTVATVTSLDYWPANSPLNTEPGINWNSDGHSGYINGGDIANVLQATMPAAVNTSGIVNNGTSVYIPNGPGENTGAAFLVGYIGIADAGGTPTNLVGCTALSYNGVPYSAAAVTSGAYTFWAFEHLYYIKSGFGAIGSTQKTVVDTLANAVASNYAATNSSGGVNPSAGNGAGIHYDPTIGVSRTVEGGVISINY